ncbi:MAG: DUF4126 family protein [Herpetosiphonaceae bacterium]|nr:DUF4126 family protein [Herpetosiphonaceae bacterium]
MDTTTLSRQATLLGVITGMRSMTGLATISAYLNHGAPQELGAPWDRLGSPTADAVSKVAALGEMIADKTPAIPARIKPGPLVGRALIGALGGGSFAQSRGESALTGAGFGALGAIASTFGFYYLRQQIDNRLHMPDFVVALAEDAAAVTLALRWLQDAEQ